MHPNVFLKTFWRMEVKPQVFVAMSFHKSYDERFQRVIRPAVEGITMNEVRLTAYRVDNSKTGDSILTDIMDGVAHSQLVLADVSVMGKDPATGYAYRNGNVMYEIGLALACRHPAEVLLIRDKADEMEEFLFDVSTIPHMTVDFANPTAWIFLQQKLMERLREQNFVTDARVQMAIRGLSNEELVLLREVCDHPPGKVWGWPETGSVNFLTMAAIPRLLDKQVIRLCGTFAAGHPAYESTSLGRIVATIASRALPSFKIDEPKPEEPKAEEPKPLETPAESGPPPAAGT